MRILQGTMNSVAVDHAIERAALLIGSWPGSAWHGFDGCKAQPVYWLYSFFNNREEAQRSDYGVRHAQATGMDTW